MSEWRRLVNATVALAEAWAEFVLALRAMEGDK